MSNILFVLYHDFSANSAVHVHNFANQLAGAGHSVAVAIPDGTTPARPWVSRNTPCFPITKWTETGLAFSPQPSPGYPSRLDASRERPALLRKDSTLCSPLLFIHLEDNEELILEANLGAPFEEIARSRTMKLPGNLAHPRNYRRFIAGADGVTMIMDRLDKFVPPALPRLILWPGADQQLFFARKKDEAFLVSLGHPGAMWSCVTRAMFTPPMPGKCAAFISPRPFSPAKEYPRHSCAQERIIVPSLARGETGA